MSKVYEFAISRKLSIVLALCCTLAAVLLFVAGTMSGVLLSPRYAASVQPKAKREVAAATHDPAKTASSEGRQSVCGTPPSAAPAAPDAVQSAKAPTIPQSNTPKSDAAPQPLPSTAEAGDSDKESAGPVAVAGNLRQAGLTSSSSSGTSDAANAGPAASPKSPIKPAMPTVADPYAVSLVVQVGSFMVEENATRLADSLRQLGYPAEIVQRTDWRQRLWYVVRLGPYREWNAASGVAMRLAANQELKPIVGPM